MTQDTVKKVIKLSQDIRDAKDCLPACRINILAEVLMNKIGSLIGRWMSNNLAVSVPAVEEYINKLQSELDSL